ncbi:BLUF domain-containing protein [Azohydromonas aeria]|uniref:BLUF domain-containing protein n=1 Tax=Azohydromonas aeria TaxID=2590212 RepID=UPI0012FA79A2|nr:BLUF domain-containing protein [Azohydromonas aeria]
MSLHRLVYISMASGLGPTPAELRALLAQSVRHNPAAGITGMLLYAHGGYMQLLEGEGAAVEGLFARIRRDPRHSRVTTLLHGPTEARSFPQWAMAFRRLDEEGAAAAALPPPLAAFCLEGFDEARLRARPGAALELLRLYSRSNGLMAA